MRFCFVPILAVEPKGFGVLGFGFGVLGLGFWGGVLGLGFRVRPYKP